MNDCNMTLGNSASSQYTQGQNAHPARQHAALLSATALTKNCETITIDPSRAIPSAPRRGRCSGPAVVRRTAIDVGRCGV
jgi:hypothetical protein